ncbi:MAG: DUF6377 domain-containing protein [Bacteroides sp.]
MNDLKRVFVAVYIIGLASIPACLSAGRTADDNEPILQLLDASIRQADEFRKEKARAIASLTAASHPQTDEARYHLNVRLYEAYMVYDSDSAMKYVDENIALAIRTGQNSWLTDSRIRKSFVLSATGLLTEALDELSGLDVPAMTDAQKVEYYGQKMYLYSHFDQFNKDANGYAQTSQACTDSLMNYIEPSHPMYLWYKGWWLMHRQADVDVIIAKLSARVDHPSEARTREYAMEAYLLARLYQERGDTQRYVRYLALSGMADVRSCNKDIASLEELGYLMYDAGDMDRAFEYLNYCFDVAQQYQNRVRIVGISDKLNKIREYYQQCNKRQERTLHYYLAALTVLAGVLLIAIGCILKQMKRLGQQRRELSETNGKLTANVVELNATQQRMADIIKEVRRQNGELNQKNNELKEANYLKEEYIGYVFTLCNSYIKKLDDYRIRINRKLKVGQTAEVKRMTENAQTVEEETKEFLHQFDLFFLNLYPNFVSDFNKLLRPEEQIVLHEDELLNTVLRIYALVRLGINDSVKIANFLHCSTQTVYNNRLKTRNKSVIPKEQFAEAVRTLGKVDI